MDDTELQANFDFIFKGRGGICDITKHYQFKYLSDALKFMRAAITRAQQMQGGLPTPYLHFINNPSINAVVDKLGNQYYIGLNIGIIFTLRPLTMRMLASNCIFTDIGDATVEDPTEKIYNAQLTDAYKVELASQNEAPEPKDRLRHFYGEMLIKAAMEFLTLHEFSHILFGHVEYKQSLLKKKSSFSETDEDPADNIFQSLERDADRFAYLCISSFYEHAFPLHKHVDEKLKSFYSNQENRLTIANRAIYLLFRLFGREEQNDWFSTVHPPPAVRLSSMFSTFLNIQMKKSEIDGKLFMDRLNNTMKPVEDGIKQLSEINTENLFEPDMAKIYIHTEILRRNWNKVRPKIEKFAYIAPAPLEFVS